MYLNFNSWDGICSTETKSNRKLGRRGSPRGSQVSCRLSASSVGSLSRSISEVNRTRQLRLAVEPQIRSLINA